MLLDSPFTSCILDSPSYNIFDEIRKDRQYNEEYPDIVHKVLTIKYTNGRWDNSIAQYDGNDTITLDMKDYMSYPVVIVYVYITTATSVKIDGTSYTPWNNQFLHIEGSCWYTIDMKCTGLSLSFCGMVIYGLEKN